MGFYKIRSIFNFKINFSKKQFLSFLLSWKTISKAKAARPSHAKIFVTVSKLYGVRMTPSPNKRKCFSNKVEGSVRLTNQMSRTRKSRKEKPFNAYICLCCSTDIFGTPIFAYRGRQRCRSMSDLQRHQGNVLDS